MVLGRYFDGGPKVPIPASLTVPAPDAYNLKGYVKVETGIVISTSSAKEQGRERSGSGMI
jgi:hypothetical protein